MKHPMKLSYSLLVALLTTLLVGGTVLAQSSVYLPQLSQAGQPEQVSEELMPAPEAEEAQPVAEEPAPLGEEPLPELGTPEPEPPVSAAVYDVTGNWRVTGRIGVGIDTPRHRLHVIGGPLWTTSGWSGSVALGNVSAIAWGGNSAGWRYGIGHANGGLYFFRTLSGFASTSNPPVYDMFINNSGNVGIGTVSPNRRLTLLGSAGTYLNVRADNGAEEVLLGADGGGGIVSTMTNHDLQLRAGGNSTKVWIKTFGYVGIGTASPQSKLTVNGGNIRVIGGSFIDDGTTLNVPDYVFEPDYPLLTLDEVRAYIADEKHLPNVPSADEIAQGGLNLSQFQMKLLEKVEELTLYTLQQDERIADLEARLAALEAQR